jgi:hypothetical protein
MRNLSRALVFVVALLLIGALSSSIFANNLPEGKFTLTHPTRWNGALLPGGVYQFMMTRTPTDANMLVISGQKQTLSVLVFAQSACDSCKTEALRMTVEGDNRIVTSMDLPGYHLDFKAPRTESAAKEGTNNSSSWTEQVAVQVDPTN